MALQLKSGTWTRRLTTPLKGPGEFIHVAKSSGEVMRLIFAEAALRPTRLTLPADYANNKIRDWNQKNGPGNGNPWKGTIGFAISAAPTGKVGNFGINIGTSVVLWRLDYMGNAAWVNGVGESASVNNWTLDKTNHKYSVETIIDNDLEETNPTEIYDDDETFWVAGSNTTATEETTIKAKGTSSLKIVISGGTGWVRHTYGSGQDWSTKEFICFYWYGSNSGATFQCAIYTSGTPTWDGYQYTFVDNFTGWKRFVVPIKAMTVSGTPSLSNINHVYFESLDDGTTGYLDRVVVDVGQWMKAETYTPDTLKSDTSGVAVYSYDGSAYQKMMAWNGTGTTSWGRTKAQLHFLDGTHGSSIWTTDDSQCLNRYLTGQRGETKDGWEGTIVYSAYYGCMKRVAFAIKMPPDDGQDSSTAGISQCRLKLEVYYADSGDPSGVYGQTTYEFSNDNNSYYGLTNMTEKWLAVFNSTLKTPKYLGFSAAITGLKVCADENENIVWMEPTLPANCMVWAGEQVWASGLATDSDGDGVPNFLDGTAPVDSEPPISSVVYEDDKAVWAAIDAGMTLEDETTLIKSGAKSLKITHADAVWGSQHAVFGAALDLQAKYHYMMFWYKGSGTGKVFRVIVGFDAAALYTNYASRLLTDNTTNWRLIIWPLYTGWTIAGTAAWNAARKVRIDNNGINRNGDVVYIDRMVFVSSRPNGIPYIVRGLRA